MAFETRIQTVRVRDGLGLAVEQSIPVDREARHRTPLLCLPGLTRTRRDFYDLRDHIAGHETRARPVVMIDARGRGGSEYADDPASYTVQQEADDVLQVCTAIGIEYAIIVGTSRGGILAMVIAIARGGMIKASILNDIGPQIATAGLIRLKEQLANGPSTLPADWDEADKRMRGALGAQFPAFDDDDWAQAARLTFADADGKPARAFDSGILEGLQAVTSDTGPIDLSGLFRALSRTPILLLRGEHSDLLDAEVAQQAIEHAEKKAGGWLETVPGQGHAPALRGSVLSRIEAFLEHFDL